MIMWVIATVTLIAGMIDDLRSQKVHNVLISALFGAVLAANFVVRDLTGVAVGLTALGLALALTVPLFMFRILGGGDVKLFAVFALAIDPVSMFWTLIYSFVWGGLFGLTRATLQRELLVLVRNTYRIARKQSVQPQEIHKIPYTFALLLGWLTQLTFLRAGLTL